MITAKKQKEHISKKEKRLCRKSFEVSELYRDFPNQVMTK
jgi:hypothetical protein